MRVLGGKFRIDCFWLGTIPLVSVLLTICLRTPYLLSIFLFYGAPAIYISFRFLHLRQILKGVIFVVIVTIPFSIVVDYIGISSGVWYVPATLFSNRFLGVIPWEDFVWMFVATYSIFAIYVACVGNGTPKLINRRMGHFMLFAILGLSCFFLVLALGGRVVFVWPTRYAYFCVGLLFFLMPAAVLWRRSLKMLLRFFPFILYFLYLTVAFEMSVSVLALWIFPGTYLFPPLILFGQNPIPYEELFFVGIVGPLAAAGFYQYFEGESS